MTLSVLVADDSFPSLMAVRAMLERLGCSVTCATRGDDALNIAQGQSFDVIFLDEYMPGMLGSEIAARLRERPNLNTNTPVFALTGANSDDDAKRLLQSPLAGVIEKPVASERLKAALEMTETPSLPLLAADALQTLREDLGDDATDRLLGLFARELSQLGARLHLAVDAVDREEIRSVSHILKNSAALYGALPLAALARELNEAPPAEHLYLREKTQQLVALCEQTREHLREQGVEEQYHG